MKKIKRFISLAVVMIIFLSGCSDNKAQLDNSEQYSEKCIVYSDALLDEKDINEAIADSSAFEEQPQIFSYIANKKSGKLHYPDCASVRQMNEENKLYLECTREEDVSKGYEPCQKCEP